MTGMSY